MLEITMQAGVSNRAALLQQIRDRLSLVVAKTAHDLEAQAKDRAPVKTGNLKNSIQAHPRTELEWEVAVGAEYGRYVEYGTVHMGAQPYLTPAVDAVRPGFLTAVERVVQRGV